MPQIKTALLLAFLALMLSLSACGDTNSKVVFSPDSGKHPADWIPGHQASAKADIETCVECHGENLDGGISEVSCTKTCHLGSSASVHPDQWGQYAYARHQSFVLANGISSCANTLCHGPALTGVAGSGVSCATTCHLGGVIAGHPAGWVNFQPYSVHASYVSQNGFAGCSTVACHGTDSTGVFLSGPSCTQCHLGGITAVHPASADWSIDHRGYVLPGFDIVQTRAKCDIAACHGTFNDATKPGQIKVDKSVCGVTCHAGDKN